MSKEKFDYKEYIKTLSPEDAEYAKRFYDDYYNNHHHREDAIITDEEMKVEANRNFNNAQTDAVNGVDGVNYLPENYDDFMSAASDAWDWQNALKLFGYEAALETITEQAIRDLDNSKIQKTIVLTRYYEQRDNLRRMENKDKREKKQPIIKDENNEEE